MKRNLIGTLSLVVLSILLSAAGASAEVVANADVPFAFMVGQKQLPAGHYSVVTVGQAAIEIQNRDVKASALTLARQEPKRDATPRLIFHSVGNQYFLSQVWTDQGQAGLIVPTTKLEKELMISRSPSTTQGNVVIALK